MFFKILIMLVLFSLSVNAQEDILIKDLLDGLVDDLPEDFDFSELNERLIFLKKHPINLNRAKSEELKSLFILSPLQIANFHSYITTNGKLIDVLELQAIPGFDQATVQKLLPFVHLAEVNNEKLSLKNLAYFGENGLILSYARTIEKQKGFRNLEVNRYLGTPEKLLFRYKYNFLNQVTFSLIMEKDAGEKLITKPSDFISANLSLKALGKIKKLNIGDYSLQFGQGLTLWSGFGFGKGPDVTNVAKKDEGLKGYSSANEYSFFRGFGTTISLSKSLDLTSFWSFRKRDATISDGFVSSLNETGYHRTLNELKNKNTISQNIYGSVINYHESTFEMGVIGYRSNYSKSFSSGNQPYRIFNFSGKKLINLGLFYNYTFKNTYFFGEIANSVKSGAAYINGFLISLSNHVSAVLLYRNYAKNYHNFFSQAVAESENFNEKGFYAGINIFPSKKWVLSFYADYFKFPWFKFRIDAPSAGYEILTQTTYTPTKTFKTSIRYKSELKQQNTANEVPINYLEDIKKHSLRLDFNWKLSKTIALQNRMEMIKFQKGNIPPEYSYLFYQDCAITPTQNKLSANFRIAYFKTPSYNSRFYAYEDDMLYNFSFGSYNGNGLRSYLNLKYKAFKHIDIWLRYALFYYKDIKVVGTGLDEINGNKKSEIKAQLRYQF